MKVKVSKWGNSLAIRIPSSIAQEVAFEAGNVVGIEAVGRELHITAMPRSESLDALIDGITHSNRHGEVEWGSAVGREAW